ncbi:MAG TPA: FAD-binding oxidoreductase [Longimicrobiales bacterium]|nr:FAD-binding oxidoreductase [Longimicrobiales bacterium]
MTTMLDSTNTDTFRDRIDGELILPSDPAYDTARKVWNARFDPRPAALVRCRSAADVVAAIELAREHRLPVSVRGGGHSYAGLGVGDGALAIDLSPMDDVVIDAEGRTATVGPGATWADFDRTAQAHGLATTGATVSSVGVAGFALGGGTGYLARRHGLGVDNVLSLEVVTADGRVLRASNDEHADLFWALRGGSGNFGVVTSFEFRLHPVGPDVVTAQSWHPIEDARAVLRFYREFMESASEDVTVYAFALRVPPVEPFPAEHHGSPALALVACHCGDVEEATKSLERLTTFGNPILAGVQTVPYTAAQQAFDAGMPDGLRWDTRGHYLNELDEDAIETFAKHVESLTGPYTAAYFEPLGGAIGRVASDATAFPHRDAAYGLHILPGWIEASDGDGAMRWMRELHDAMAPHATGGVYVNLLGRDEADRVPAAYGANYARLAGLKAKYDPGNLFRVNQNITAG